MEGRSAVCAAESVMLTKGSGKRTWPVNVQHTSLTWRAGGSYQEVEDIGLWAWQRVTSERPSYIGASCITADHTAPSLHVWRLDNKLVITRKQGRFNCQKAELSCWKGMELLKEPGLTTGRGQLLRKANNKQSLWSAEEIEQDKSRKRWPSFTLPRFQWKVKCAHQSQEGRRGWSDSIFNFDLEEKHKDLSQRTVFFTLLFRRVQCMPHSEVIPMETLLCMPRGTSLWTCCLVHAPWHRRQASRLGREFSKTKVPGAHCWGASKPQRPLLCCGYKEYYTYLGS